MATYKTRKIESALSKKGFQLRESSHHKKWTLFVDGKKTAVYTWISHGLKEYGDSLLREMKKELYLDSQEELDALLSCPMSEEELIRLLKKRGIIK